jgi:hypothetical protein
MKKTSVPQDVSFSDTIYPLGPSNKQIDSSKLLDQLEEEYDKKL